MTSVLMNCFVYLWLGVGIVVAFLTLVALAFGVCCFLIEYIAKKFDLVGSFMKYMVDRHMQKMRKRR